MHALGVVTTQVRGIEKNPGIFTTMTGSGVTFHRVEPLSDCRHLEKVLAQTFLLCK